MRDKKLREILDDEGILHFASYSYDDNSYAGPGRHYAKVLVQAGDIRRVNKKIEALLDYLGLQMSKIETDNPYKVTKKK